MREGFITVQRTARYHVTGDARSARALWVVLHGYGQLARYFLRHFENLEGNAIIVAPEGLSRFYLDDGHTRVGATWMTREDREHEIIDQGRYLDAIVAELRKNSPTIHQVCALGFSQGVATLARWSMHTSTPLHRLVFWSGSLPPDIARDDMSARWAAIETHVVHGDHDTITPLAVFEKNLATLRLAGLEPDTHRFPGGHQLDRMVLERLLTA